MIGMDGKLKKMWEAAKFLFLPWRLMWMLKMYLLKKNHT